MFPLATLGCLLVLLNASVNFVELHGLIFHVSIRVFNPLTDLRKDIPKFSFQGKHWRLGKSDFNDASDKFVQI